MKVANEIKVFLLSSPIATHCQAAVNDSNFSPASLNINAFRCALGHILKVIARGGSV